LSRCHLNLTVVVLNYNTDSIWLQPVPEPAGDSSIHKHCSILYQLLATPGVNVAKNVKQWSSSPELGKKVGTSEAVEIQMTFWRTIGNENINIIRYGIMPNVELARVLEGPVSLLWCPRASMYFKLAT
jgi:hypothetical protein